MSTIMNLDLIQTTFLTLIQSVGLTKAEIMSEEDEHGRCHWSINHDASLSWEFCKNLQALTSLFEFSNRARLSGDDLTAYQTKSDPVFPPSWWAHSDDRISKLLDLFIEIEAERRTDPPFGVELSMYVEISDKGWRFFLFKCGSKEVLLCSNDWGKTVHCYELPPGEVRYAVEEFLVVEHFPKTQSLGLQEACERRVRRRAILFQIPGSNKMNKCYKNLFRSLPGNDSWEGSFYERLVEYGIWDEQEFWKFHKDLIDIAKLMNHRKVEWDIATAVVRLYVKIASLISSHFNANDIFKIQNLTDSELLEFYERLDLAVVGAFSGEILDESRFDLRNPLLDE